MSDAPDAIAARLADLESRLSRVEQQNAPTLDATGARERMGYKSAKRFWEAVRRLGVPYSRLSPKHAVFRTSDIDAVLQRRRIGSRRARA